MEMFKEFKPALMFLGKFLGVYILGNLLYGLYINHYYPQSDPATAWVSHQVSEIITLSGQVVNDIPNPTKPTISLVDQFSNRIIVNVFEGCNGINVAIVFIAFLIAFQGTVKRTLIFSMVGLLTIHVFNLGRIILLYQQAKVNSPYFYYLHKYFFTFIIYFVVFILWWIWISKVNKLQERVSR